jgi:hypothetical protein
MTKTVADLFMNSTHNVTWKYYDHLVQVGGYKAAVNSSLAFDTLSLEHRYLVI